MEKLQGIIVGRTRVGDAGLAHLERLKGLLSLDLGKTAVTDAGMAPIAGFSELQYVNLSGNRVSDAGVVHLANLKKLRKLMLNGTRVTDAGLTQMFNLPLPPLASLELRGARVSATGAAAIRSIFPKIDLDWWEPNRRAAEAVLGAGGAVRVRADGNGSEALIKSLSALPAQYFRLTAVIVAAGRRPSNELIQMLAALNDPEFDDLQEVDLSGAAITDADLEQLATLPCRRLVLNGTPLAGPGLSHLRKMPRLTDLSLECPSLTFLGMQYVAELKNLKRLSLAHSGVNDASIKHLSRLVNLREVDLTGTMVTAKGIAELKAALPMCQIKSGAVGAQ
jgi:hypothetical protein